MPDDPTPLGDHIERVRAKAEARQAAQADRMDRKKLDQRIATQREVAQVEAETRQRQARVAQWHALVPSKYHDADLADFQAEAQASIGRWQGNWRDGVNLLITGPVGSGKTRAAFAAARGPVGEGAGLAFWPDGELRDALDWRADNHAAVQAGCMDLDLLIIDDLGVDISNDWWLGKVYAILNRRWLEDRPTIITTNLEPTVLRKVLTDRTFSRLADNAIGVRLTGDDRRSQRRAADS